MTGPLSDIRIVDLSRVLAGPFCTQILGDLGADIIKIEKPGAGDDTRKWGPPYLKDKDGKDTSESAYYLSANRNKRSAAIDIATPEGRELIHRLLEKSDILIENFKTGGLKKYSLDFSYVHKKHPHIIYASITGFGQTGPLSAEPGYDLMAQAMAGMMAVTGEPAGEPMKIGVALSDIMTGLYAAIGILSALHKRRETGRGQQIDVALVDCTLASLTNLAQYYLTSGKVAARFGNSHSTIVPYQAFEAADGWMVVAVGNDSQFARFAKLLGHEEWAKDPRFATNPARVIHRDVLLPLIAVAIKNRTRNEWLEGLEAIDVPGGPVNRIDEVFAMEQIQARNMRIEMGHALASDPVPLIGSPLKLSETGVSYRQAPPVCGQNTDQVLRQLLELDTNRINELRARGVVA
ncbi:MAG TPA: CaiB/BaiF CoA-transferase family protein [Patescibacteria group bacterium]|nr:CaiB/BaiF CoA-transferase family protein [Patescibacteria group bacterium]